jgi:competence protein ComEC
MKEFLKNQYKNLFLWTPIFSAFGMALYFSLFSEPNIITLSIIFSVGLISGILLRKFPILILLSFFAIGFGYAGIYTHTKTVKPLSHDTHGIEISGIITDLDYANDKIRLYLQTENFGNVRVSTDTTINFNIGDKISGTGGLFKPKTADIPDGFDFARWAYFDNITATGYINNINIVYTNKSGVYNIRNKIKNASNSFLVDALVLGYKHALPDGHRKVWATNGVAHIWSISGYHMTLVAGWLFIIFYLIFRSWPYIVRRIPARIPALICSWVGLCAYVLLSGASVATLRAFIMATLVIIAFILGRIAISTRMVMIAFITILAINPSYVMHAGFQLSFAAVLGIIWLWHNVKPTMPKFKPVQYIYGAFLTALVATVFTAPFVVAHFGSFPIYGIVGNMVFLPIFSFLIMPLVFVGSVFATFGIKSPLVLSHRIYDYIFNIAERIFNLATPNFEIGSIPNIAIVMFVIGLACLVFIQNNDRFKYLIFRHLNIVLWAIFCIVGITICITEPRPIFYIATNHKLIAAVTDGKLKFNKSHDSSNFFAFDTWKTSNGDHTGDENELLSKESGVYRIHYPKFDIVYIQSFVPLSKNIKSICSDPNVKYFASYFDINVTKCNAQIIKNGAVIYKNGKIKYIPFNRPWHNRPE